MFDVNVMLICVSVDCVYCYLLLMVLVEVWCYVCEVVCLGWFDKVDF